MLRHFFALYPDIALAAEAIDQTTVAQIKNSFSTAMGSKFTDNLSALFLSFQHIARIIVVIMTALAGIMIAFGVGGANQMFFKWIFGVGVVANIADFGWDFFGDYWVDNGTVKADDASGEMEKIIKLHGAKENDAA